MGDETEEAAAGAFWLKSILERPEEHVVQMIQQDPCLVSRKISMVCLGQLKLDEKPECSCSTTLETLQLPKGERFPNLLSSLYPSILLGVCPHVLAILNNYEETKSSLEPEHQQDKIAPSAVYGLVTKLYQKHQRHGGALSRSDTGDSVLAYMLMRLIHFSNTASITAIHVATAFGKLRILEQLLTYIPKNHFWRYFETGCHSINPFHIAVIHKQHTAIDLLRKNFHNMICCMDRGFDRDNFTAPTLAASFDDVVALKLLLKRRESDPQIRRGFSNSDTLYIALKNESLSCVKYLAKRNSVLNYTFMCRQHTEFTVDTPFPTITLIKDLLKKRARSLIKLVVNHQCVPVFLILALSVSLDEVEMSEFILTSTKAKVLLHKSNRMPFLTMAAFKNSPQMLRLLTKHFRNRKTNSYQYYSALTWAKILKYSTCAKILANVIPPDKDVNECPPLSALFLEKSIYVDKSEVFERLIELGYDINDVSSESWETCLSIVTEHPKTEKETGHLVSRMLELGADVFITNVFNSGNSVLPPMVIHLLHANVDISRRPILEFVSYNMMNLILQSAHTLHHSDIECLQLKLNTDSNESLSLKELQEYLKDYNSKPRSLLVLCRNCIRRRAGIQIHRFLKSQILPRTIIEILNLKKELGPYWGTETGVYWDRNPLL